MGTLTQSHPSHPESTAVSGSAPVRFGRLLFFIYLPAVTVLGLILLIIAWKDISASRELHHRDELRHIDLQKMVIHNNLRGVIDDLSLLRDHRAIREFLQGNRYERLTDVEELFKDFCKVKGYRRVSLLDPDQDLLVRGYKDRDTLEINSEVSSRLEARDSDYFNQVFNLGKNEMYMINFDLSNVPGQDSGSVNVLRLGRPVFSADGMTEGVIVINCRVEDVVAEMRTASRGSRGRLLLLDSMGRLITRTHLELGLSQTLSELLPETTSQIENMDRGDTENRDGLVCWDKIYPFHLQTLPGRSHDEEAADWLDWKEDPRKAHWTIVSWIPREDFDGILHRRKVPYMAVFIILSILLSPGAWYLAQAIEKRRSAETEVRASRDILLVQKKAIDFELELARNVMESMLMTDFQRFEPLEVSAFYRPSGEIGGDFYDLIRLQDGQVYFFLFDVVGHGVPAALNTAQARGSFQKSIFDGLSPAHVLQAVNEHLLDQLGDSRFLTAFVGQIDWNNQTLTCSCAACPSPLYLRDGEKPREIRTQGTFIGLVPGFEFTEEVISLQEGDRLLMYTDGLTESRNSMGDMWGDEGLEDAVCRHRKLPLQDSVTQIIADCDRFATGTVQVDDITLLAVEFRQDHVPG